MLYLTALSKILPVLLLIVFCACVPALLLARAAWSRLGFRSAYTPPERL